MGQGKQASELPSSLDTRPSRRRRRRTVALLIIPLVLVSLLWSQPALLDHHCIRRPKSIDERVESILSRTPLIDTHVDLPIYIRAFNGNKIYNNFTFDEGIGGHVDVPRLREGRLGGVIWSVFVPCPAPVENANEPYRYQSPYMLFAFEQREITKLQNPGVTFGELGQLIGAKWKVLPEEQRRKYRAMVAAEKRRLAAEKTPEVFRDSLYYETVHDTYQQVDLVHRLIAAYPDTLEFATSPAAVVAAHSRGKIGSLLGAEGLHQIGNSASTLRMLFSLGVRYVTLTHTCNNKYADGVEAPGGAFWNGLSPEGELMVAEMNRIGMMVDLSHVTADTMRDVLRVTKAPVIFSHSSAYSICPHPRNVPDDVLWMVKGNGGVVQVNYNPPFVHCKEGENPDDATLSHVADHVEHIGNLIGWEHVGIGSDYDGIMSTPEGLEHIGKHPDLFKELLRRGVTDQQARMVAGENVLRVWSEVERVAWRMQSEGALPLEDDVKPLWPENAM